MSLMYRASPLLAAALLLSSACGEDPTNLALQVDHEESYGTTEQGLVAGCGNGVVEPELGETCDDGNNAPSDGCDPLCQVESGYVCVGERPSQCSAPDRSDGPSSYGEAQHNRSLPPSSPFNGQEFWTGFPHNLGYPERLALKIAGASGTQGTVRSKSGTTLASFTIPASGVSTVTVDVATYEVQSLNTVTNQGVRISANQPVRVLATSEHEYTTDTWAVWSTDKLGTDYRVLSLENVGTDHEQILVVGTAAQTSVTLMNRQGQTVVSFTLDAGDTYLHRPSQPMTGFQLLSSQPIAVITGSHCEVMGSACDMTAEQLPPVRNWARDYVITPAFPGITTQSRHAVYAAFDSTAVVVTRSDGQTYNRVLAAGERWVFAGIGDARANGYFITADKPVAAATLSDDAGQNWDPSLVFWPPIDGYVTEAKMPTSGSLVAYSNFLSLITRTNATSQLRVNGSTVSGWKPIASTGYSFTIISVPQGDNEITALAGVKFGAIATGGQEYVSYGYSSPYDIAVVGGTTTTYLGDTPPDYEGPFVGGWTADTDDLQGVDDEDALVGTTSIRHGDPSPSLVIPCNDNYLGEDVNATVHGWIDFNRDGLFTQDERASAACDDPSLATTGSATLSWSNPTYSTAGISLIRLRICDENATCDTPQGLSYSGEVEDHRINIGGCGDSFVDTFEACDDGNGDGGDGCSATCTVEPDFSCSGNPSVCLIGNAPAILSPTSGTLTNTSTYPISGSCEEGAIVRVWGGDALKCIDTCVDSAFSCIVEDLAEGAHSFSADQRYGDLTSTRSAATILNVDLLAPDAPILGAPLDGAVVGTRRPVFSGSCEPGAIVRVQRQGGANACSTTCSLQGTFSCAPTADLAQGAYPFVLEQTDVAARTSPLSLLATITIDTTAPAAPAILAPANGASLGSPAVSFSGSCESGASVTIYEGLGQLCTASCEDGAFSCDALLANGAHAVSARQRDAAGNTSPFAAMRSFSILAPPPTPTFLVPAEGALVHRSVLTVSCLPGNTVSITDGTTQLCAGFCPASSFTCQPTLPEGSHTVYASQTDATPTTSPQSEARSFSLDMTAPPAPALHEPTNGAAFGLGPIAFAGSCADDSMVQITNGPATLCTTPCVNDAFSCVAAELPEAIYQIIVRQSDAAGNISPDSGMTAFTVDYALLGYVVLDTPAEGAFTGPNPIASGACQAGSTVEVQSHFSGPCESACVDGFYSCELGPLSDGDHTIVAFAKDDLGNIGPLGPPRNFIVDGTPPAAPSLTSPAADAYLSNPSPSFIGNCENGALVEVLDGSDLICTATCVGLSFSCTPASPLVDGSWTVTFQQTDLAGNLGPSIDRTFHVDTVAPSAPVLDIDYSRTNNSTPLISGSCEDEATVQVFVGMAPSCTAVCTDAAFACNASPLTDGLQMVHAQQTDRAGNQGSASTPYSFFVDTVPPFAPVPISPVPDSILATSTPTFTGACENQATVTIYEGANLLCTTSCVGIEYACVSAPLIDGAHTYFAVQHDLAGNEGIPSRPIDFVVDTTPPAAPAILAPAADAFVSDSTPTISGSCETGATVEIFDSAALLCTASCAASAFSCDTVSLGDGEHLVFARQTDVAGNIGPASALRSFLVDTAAPAAPFIVGPPADIFIPDSTLVLSGLCETHATVEIVEEDEILCSASCTSSSFSCRTTVLLDGPHTAFARQRDRAGNLSAASADLPFTIDTTTPAAPSVTAPAEGAFTSDSTPTISGTCETDAAVSVFQGSDLLCSATCAASSFSCDAAAMADGERAIIARQSDRAGNESLGSAQRTFIVDTVAPTAPIVSQPVAEAFLSDATPTIAGSCETHASITVLEDSTFLCTAICADSAFSCEASTLSEGAHLVSARQTDRAGNQSDASAPRSFTVDTIVPAAPTILAPVADVSLSDPTPTVSGSCEEHATVEVLEGSTVLCSATCATEVFACNTSSLTEGTHQLTVRQEDRAGNVSAASAPRSFVVDTIAPVAPSLLQPVEGVWLSDRAPTFAGSCEDHALVEVIEGGSVVCSIVCADSAFSCDAVSLGDGEHIVVVTQTDVAGNIGPASAQRSFFVDTTSPAAPVIAAPAVGVFLSDSTPIISGSCEDHATVEILEGGDVLCSASCTSSAFSCETTQLPEGLRTLSARQSDRAGNLSAPGVAHPFTVDTSAPSAPTVTAPAAGAFVSDSTPTISGTCESDASVSVSQGSTLLCSATCTGSSYSCEAAALADGEHSVVATQTDRAGNESAASAQRTFIVDTAPPAAPIFSQPAADAFLSTRNPTIAGSCETHASIMVLEGSTFVCTAICIDAAFTCEASTLNEGAHLVSTRQTDRAGNQSEASAPLAFTVDTTAPVAPTILAPAAGAFLSDATPAVSGSCEEHATVEILEGAQILCSTTCVASAFACDTTELGEGLRSLTLRQEDRAGNVSVASATRTFTVDTIAPAAPSLVEPIAGIWLSDSTPTFAGSCESNATVNVREGSELLCSTTCTASAFSCDATFLAEGSHAVSVVQTDRAGNASTASTPMSFNVDTVVPASPAITAPTDGAAFSNSTPTVSGSCESEAVVEVLEGSTVLCTATCAGSSFACTTSLLAEGAHAIMAAQTDRAGNRSAVGSAISFTVDTIPPAAALLTSPAPDELLAEGTPTFEGTAEPHSTVSVWSDGVQICSATAAADGSWSCVSEIDLADGRRSIEVRVRDTVGNETASQRVTPIFLDTRAPMVPSLLVPASGQEVSGWTTFIGLAEPGVTVLVVVDGQVICSAIADKGGRYACLSSEELTGGPHSVSVFAADDAGNESDPSRALDFSASSDAPPSQAVIENPLYEDSHSGTNPIYEGLAEPGSTVSVRVNGVEVCTAIATPAGEFSCSPAHSLPDGDHVVTAVATNANGKGQPSLPTTFVVDRSPPQAPSLTYPAASETVGTMPALVGNAEPGAQVRILVDDVEICTTVADASGGFACMPEAPLAPGVHSISLESTDAAGNTSTATTSSFTAQSGRAPDAILSQPVGGTASGDSTVTFAGRAEPGSTVEVSADGSVLCTAVALPSGDWTCTADLDDGAHSIEVQATNEDGTGRSHSHTELVIDAVPPAAPSLLAPLGDEPTSSRPIFSGTAEPSSQVQIYVDGQLVCVTQASETGAFECALLMPLSMGAHSAEVAAIDAAGNVSERSAVIDFLTSPVALSLDEPSTELPLANSTPTFAGKSEPGDLVSVIVDGEVICQAEADQNGDWSCTPAQPLGEGARTISVSSDNGYGTVRTTSAQGYVIDTIAPSIPTLDTPQAGEDLLGSATTFAGSAEPGSTVRVLVDGALACTAVAASDGSWSCEADFEGGAHEVSITSTDLAGNVSPSSSPISFLKTTELSAPNFTSPAPAAYLTSTEIVFAGTAIPKTTITVYDEDGAALCSVLADEDGAFTCTGLAQRGKNTVHAVSTWQDLESPASAETSFTVAGAGRFVGGGCASSSGGTSTWGFLALGLLLLGARRKR